MEYRFQNTRLQVGRDNDILQFLASLGDGEKGHVIRQAIRMYMRATLVTPATMPATPVLPFTPKPQKRDKKSRSAASHPYPAEHTDNTYQRPLTTIRPAAPVTSEESSEYESKLDAMLASF